jgi:hypothetical protein
MWNWQKIEGIKNLPEFDKLVLLYQEKDGKKYAVVGYLQSINAKGANWSINGNGMDFLNIFIPIIKGDFNPSHWCEIEVPISEKPIPETPKK